MTPAVDIVWKSELSYKTVESHAWMRNAPIEEICRPRRMQPKINNAMGESSLTVLAANETEETASTDLSDAELDRSIARSSPKNKKRSRTPVLD